MIVALPVVVVVVNVCVVKVLIVAFAAIPVPKSA